MASEPEVGALMKVPDISALEATQKGWVLEKGLLRPKVEQNLWTNITIQGNSSWFYPSWQGFYSTPFASGVVAPSLPLPTEKRDMPVIGYRAWGFSAKYRIGIGRDVALKSTGVDHHWAAGDNHATCRSVAHPAPDQGCGCGFYVLASLDELESHVTLNDGIIVGAVMGWGKVIQHGTEGWRAEYAKIVGFLDCKFSKGQSKNTEAAAEAYRAQVYSRSAVETYLKEWGDPFQGAA